MKDCPENTAAARNEVPPKLRPFLTVLLDEAGKCSLSDVRSLGSETSIKMMRSHEDPIAIEGNSLLSPSPLKRLL